MIKPEVAYQLFDIVGKLVYDSTEKNSKRLLCLEITNEIVVKQ